jgi:hypothetical protein
MKPILGMLLVFPCLALSQEPDGYHQHDGFFLSMSGGAATGAITLDASGTSYRKLEFSGAGGMIDLKIGGTIAKTVSLSADLMNRAISGPDVDVDGTKGSASSKVSASDQLIGLGITYYFMPINIFVSGTLGIAKFILKNEANDLNASSESGFGLSLKAGKEWWVGANWGLGVSAGFATAGADDKGIPGNPGYSGKLSTNKFFILFNTTYN